MHGSDCADLIAGILKLVYQSTARCKYYRESSGKIPLPKISESKVLNNKTVCASSKSNVIKIMAPKHGAKSPKDRRRAGSVSNAAEVPSFDEAALSSLTNKIEAGFRTAAVSKAHPQPDGDSVNLKLSGASIKGPQKIKEHGKRTENGKKRDAEGNVKQSVNGSLSNRKIAKDRRKDGKTDDSSILLQEILALGGTEEDMELVAGADSDEEDDKGGSDQPAAVDSKFTKELSKFVSGLGITRITQEDASASGSSSEIDDIESHELDEVNDDKSILEYDTAVKPLKTSIAPRDKSEALNQKNSNRLVSESSPETKEIPCSSKPLDL
jgi:ribosome biogenesis protein MAK21